MSSTIDVLIVGAGPTGLFLAHELARQGAVCRVIDKLPRATELSKAFAIHARSLEMLDQAGVVEDFAAEGLHVCRVNIYAGGKRIVRMSLDQIESRFPYLLSIPQSQTERLLARQVQARGVRVERPVELTGFTQDGDDVTATLRGLDGTTESVRARYLVGCDGAHSTVRHALGIDFDGAPYEEVFGLADLTLRGDFAPDEMHTHLSDDGPLFILGFGGQRFRLIANLPGGEAGTEMTLPEWQAILARRLPFKAEVVEARWMTRFKIHRRHARTLRQGRAFLAGDAAHIHSPAGGQGMNTGLQDAHNLAWKLARVAQGRAAPELLDTYQTERHPIHAAVLAQTDQLTQIGLVKNRLVRALRDRLVPLLAGLPLAQQQVGRRVAELSIQYRASPLSQEGKLPGGPRSGDHAPDADVELGGVRHRLTEFFRHGRYTLLTFAGTSGASMGAAGLDALRRQVAQAFPDDVAIQRLSLAAEAGRPGLVDVERQAHRAYGARVPSFYLVRPDGYVAHRGPATASATASLRRYLDTWLRTPASDSLTPAQ